MPRPWRPGRRRARPWVAQSEKRVGNTMEEALTKLVVHDGGVEGLRVHGVTLSAANWRADPKDLEDLLLKEVDMAIPYPMHGQKLLLLDELKCTWPGGRVWVRVNQAALRLCPTIPTASGVTR